MNNTGLAHYYKRTDNEWAVYDGKSQFFGTCISEEWAKWIVQQLNDASYGTRPGDGK